jgi:hyaluronan synthase
LNTEVHSAGITEIGAVAAAEPERPPREKWWIIIGCIFILSLVVYFKYFNYRWFWYEPVFQFYSLGVATYILTRVAFSCFYRIPADRQHFPKITVAIAVKDEEEAIAATIRHCYASGYPEELMEVIVVDDGSTDDTWDVIQGLTAEHAALRTFRFAENKGKRFAMALAAREAQGEILVYVDSDSFVEKGAIYRLVQPFADEQVGAVAGNISISVDDDWILSKMERVRYFVSHRVIKASESVFDAVTCCSGAFSAYRRTEVLKVLDWWLNQSFLGTQCTFGDDRALTNQVLKHNKVVFHHGAVAWTRAPETWSMFFRQQLRWKKSWTRETWVAAQILYRKHPIAAASYYAGIVMTLISPLIVFRALVFMPIFASATAIPYLTGLVLVYLFFCMIFRYHTASRYWLYGLAFAALYIGVLCWQNYYAIATVRKTHWGTR